MRISLEVYRQSNTVTNAYANDAVNGLRGKCRHRILIGENEYSIV